jgi:hypothetical protein
MSFDIITTKNFEKEAKQLIKKYASFKVDLARLCNELKTKNDLGISIGGNAFKLRMAIGSKGKGKSGGARMITYLYQKGNQLFLLSIYDKSEQENISDKKLQLLIDMIDAEINS